MKKWSGGAALFVSVGLSALTGCRQAPAPPPPPPPAKHFQEPIFDGLSLGMERDAVQRLHPIRPALTSSGKSLGLWVFERPGDYTVHLSFPGRGGTGPLSRIDVHYGTSSETADAVIDRLSRSYGSPDVRRRKATINAYGDRRHDQFETIWSDAEQYVFFTERVPLPGRGGRPAYFLSIKKKQITATGPPTGYVPPPPPVDDEGRPIEDPIF
jgi:hypothetical protein